MKSVVCVDDDSDESGSDEDHEAARPEVPERVRRLFDMKYIDSADVEKEVQLHNIRRYEGPPIARNAIGRRGGVASAPKVGQRSRAAAVEDNSAAGGEFFAVLHGVQWTHIVLLIRVSKLCSISDGDNGRREGGAEGDRGGPAGLAVDVGNVL